MLIWVEHEKKFYNLGGQGSDHLSLTMIES